MLRTSKRYRRKESKVRAIQPFERLTRMQRLSQCIIVSSKHFARSLLLLLLFYNHTPGLPTARFDRVLLLWYQRTDFLSRAVRLSQGLSLLRTAFPRTRSLCRIDVMSQYSLPNARSPCLFFVLYLPFSLSDTSGPQDLCIFFGFMNSIGLLGSLGSIKVIMTLLSSLKSTGLVT